VSNIKSIGEEVIKELRLSKIGVYHRLWLSPLCVLLYRARRSEARIQLMLWKVNYSDIVFVNTVCSDVMLW